MRCKKYMYNKIDFDINVMDTTDNKRTMLRGNGDSVPLQTVSTQISLQTTH